MNEETEFHMLAQDHFDCFDPYSEKAVPMRQPIHKTIKPIVKTAPERFELTWEMIERISQANAIPTFWLPGPNPCDPMSFALGIILQCRTFSPGVFEKNENGRWQRAGENPKHANLEGC